MEIDPTEVSIFRGGSSFDVRPMDIKIDKATGNVKTTHGLSLDINADKMEKFGGANLVESIPAELRVIQRGKNLGHFELVPRKPMTPQRFQELTRQINSR